MIVGTWNCRMGVDRKADAILALGCDVLVVPECSDTPVLARDPDVSFAWKGRYPVKGLGAFAFSGWRLEPLEAAVELPWVLPLRAIAPSGEQEFTLLAIWTVANAEHRWPSYAGQVTLAVDAWESILETEPVVLAGDLNCSAQGPSATPHLVNVDRIHTLGARSAYHHHRGVEHGAEDAMTLRWIGPGRVPYTYHCDFVFLSRPLLRQLGDVRVGTMEDWVESGLSDHTPVTVELT